MGKHAARGSALRVPILAIATIGVAALVVATALYVRARGDSDQAAAPTTPTCGDPIRIVTASSFASVLYALAAQLSGDDNCLNLEVDVADGRAAPEVVNRTDADVWIPDDSSWIGVADGTILAPEKQAGSGAVVAETPIYMVTDASTAGRLRAAGGSWLGLANLLVQNSGVRLVVRDPEGSGDGMVGAGGIGEAVWIGKGMDASSLALARVLRVTRTVTGHDPAMPARPGEVGLVPEYALLPLLSGATAPTILAGTDYALVLRYTWLPTAAAVKSPSRAGRLDRLRRALTGTDVTAALNEARLRPPNGDEPPPGAKVQLPGLARDRMRVLGPHHVDHVLATWYEQDRRTNLLAVIDVSGSMGQLAPGSQTRLIDIVREGCRSLGRLLPDDSRVGIWEFGAALDPPRDYRVLLPTRPLAGGHRAALEAALGKLAPRRTGTGLYDTILAAYVAARNEYQSGVSNQVLLFTDGRNEADPGSISLAQLTASLQRAHDPARPIQLSVVAFGQKEEANLLKRALEPVDGYVAELSTVDDVAAAFIHVSAGGLHDH